MTALEGQGWSLLIFFSFFLFPCEKENKWSTVHQTLARGKQLGGSGSKITSVLGNNKGGTNSVAHNFFFFFFWSLLFCDFVIKRMGSDLQTMDSWFISTAGPCGRCSFFSQRHMQIPTVPPLSLHNCRLFRQQKEAHLCACVCVRAQASVSVRAAHVLVRVQPYFKR